MQLDWITTFLEVSKTHNFNVCAENLGVMQSTVSSRIRALEEALGVRLFARGRGGAKLTAEGARFLTHAENIRLSWNLASLEAGGGESHQGVLRVSTQMSISEHLVNAWVAELRRLFPLTSIHLESDYSKNMLEELQRGELDMAVLYSPEYTASLEIEHLYNDRFVMISTEPLHIDQIHPGNYVFVALTDYFKARHHELLPQLHSAAITVGLSMVSRSYMQEHGGAAYTSERQAKQLVTAGEFFSVVSAPMIEQPVFVSYLSKNRHIPIYAAALTALRNIIAL